MRPNAKVRAALMQFGLHYNFDGLVNFVVEPQHPVSFVLLRRAFCCLELERQIVLDSFFMLKKGTQYLALFGRQYWISGIH